MKKAYFLPLVLATAVTSVAFAYDDVYTNVFTGVTSVAALPDGVPGADGATWSKEGDVALTNVNNEAVGFESDGAAVLKLTVTETPQDQNTIFRVTVTGTVEEVETLMTPGVGVQTAFAVCTNGTSESCFWAWDGAEWQGLGAVPEGFDGSAPTNLTVEISYQGTNNTRKVRFAIGGEYLNSENWTDLVSGSAALTNDNLNAVGVNGSGTLAAVNGEVMLGVAELNGVKYGTLTEAIEKASEGAEVVVVRPTDEDVELDKNVKIADGGNVKGDIKVKEGSEVAVDLRPAKEEFVNPTAAGTSGEYVLPVKVAGATVTITLPPEMNNKEIVGDVTRDETTGKVKVTIQTATSILAGATPGGKALKMEGNEASLRAYLNTHANAAYVDANVSSDTIKTAWEQPRTGDGENGLALYQSYALGIAPTVSVKPVTVANDVADDGVTLSIPALVSPTLSGDYTPKYKVWNADTNIEYSVASEIKVPLKTGSYTVDIVFENPVSE